MKAETTVRFNFQRSIAFSLTGETVYLLSTDWRNPKATAWDVSSEEPVGEVCTLNCSCLVARMKGGVLLSTFQGCLDMWNFDLSNCVRRWFNLDPFHGIIPISEERVALRNNNRVIILNTTTSEIVSIPIDHGYVVSCNSKCQLLTGSSDSLQLLDGQTTLWKTAISFPSLPGTFSLSERFVLICAQTLEGGLGMNVLDAFSGRILHSLCKDVVSFYDCQFVIDEECVILSKPLSGGSSLRLFNVESGELLSVINLERDVYNLAVCPRTRLLAIDSERGFELIQVHFPRGKDQEEQMVRC